MVWSTTTDEHDHDDEDNDAIGDDDDNGDANSDDDGDVIGPGDAIGLHSLCPIPPCAKPLPLARRALRGLHGGAGDGRRLRPPQGQEQDRLRPPRRPRGQPGARRAARELGRLAAHLGPGEPEGDPPLPDALGRSGADRRRGV